MPPAGRTLGQSFRILQWIQRSANGALSNRFRAGCRSPGGFSPRVSQQQKVRGQALSREGVDRSQTSSISAATDALSRSTINDQNGWRQPRPIGLLRRFRSSGFASFPYGRSDIRRRTTRTPRSARQRLVRHSFGTTISLTDENAICEERNYRSQDSNRSGTCLRNHSSTLEAGPESDFSVVTK